ncbi:hypothetical protein ABK040_002585 [Willaertia magna]
MFQTTNDSLKITTTTTDNDHAVNNEIPILAFGASITAGYHSEGRKFHPYSIHLTELLNNSNNNIKVYEYGYSGETTGQMVERIKRCLQKQLTEEDKYGINNWEFPNNEFKVVIIIGGTNDLGKYQTSKETIVENLQNIYNYCKSKLNILYVIACSIPSTTFEHLERFENSYLKKKIFVNNFIENYCKENNEKMRFVDICNLLSYKDCDELERKMYWDDCLHFTPKGYDKIAEILYETSLRDLMSKLQNKY